MHASGFRRILFAGDSFTRQLYQAALISMLPNEVRNRPDVIAPRVPWAPSSADLSPLEGKACDALAVSQSTAPLRGCRHHFVRDTSQPFRHGRRPCDGKIEMEFVYAGVHETNQLSGKGTSKPDFPSILDANTNADLVILGWGIWDNFSSTVSYDRLIAYTAALRKTFASPRVIWLAADFRHPFHDQRFELQANSRVVSFNAEMHQRLRALQRKAWRKLSNVWTRHGIPNPLYKQHTVTTGPGPHAHGIPSLSMTREEMLAHCPLQWRKLFNTSTGHGIASVSRTREAMLVQCLRASIRGHSRAGGDALADIYADASVAPLIFSSYDFTATQVPYDGTHYTLSTNTLRWNALLWQLEDMSVERALGLQRSTRLGLGSVWPDRATKRMQALQSASSAPASSAGTRTSDAERAAESVQRDFIVSLLGPREEDFEEMQHMLASLSLFDDGGLTPMLLFHEASQPLGQPARMHACVDCGGARLGARL